MNQTNSIDFLRNQFKDLLNKYRKQGHVNNGVNGPYNDEETETRNLCHLIVMTSVEYLKFGNAELKEDLARMGSQLLSYCCQGNGLSIMRNKSTKDISNGVIGHSWVLEGLLYLYKTLDDIAFLDTGLNIIRSHRFDEKEKLWHRPKYENLQSDCSIDYTLNHQLWFTASVAEFNCISKDTNINQYVDDFLGNLRNVFKTRHGGLVCHSIYRRKNITGGIKNYLKKSIDSLNCFMGRPSLKYKEEGYHLFNLMAISRIVYAGKNVSFSAVRKAIKYIDDDLIKRMNNKNVNLDNSINHSHLNADQTSVNIYGYPYNVPGYEILFINHVFPKIIDEKTVNSFFEKQIKEVFSDNFAKCFDKNTIQYRLYEFYRFLEICNDSFLNCVTA